MLFSILRLSSGTSLLPWFLTQISLSKHEYKKFDKGRNFLLHASVLNYRWIIYISFIHPKFVLERKYFPYLETRMLAFFPWREISRKEKTKETNCLSQNQKSLSLFYNFTKSSVQISPRQFLTSTPGILIIQQICIHLSNWSGRNWRRRKLSGTWSGEIKRSDHEPFDSVEEKSKRSRSLNRVFRFSSN